MLINKHVDVKECVYCVSMPEYGLDCQSRHSKSYIVNDWSMSTEVLRVIGYRSTRSKLFRFLFRSKEWSENRSEGGGKGHRRVQECPLLTEFFNSVITDAQRHASIFETQQLMVCK